jgi:glycerophosphoryl diester phosphodiesterase
MMNMGVRDWDIVTNYVDSVTTTLKTVTFPKVQEQVKVKNQGNANITYTIGSQSGTLTPGQSVTVNEDISSFTIQAASGTQAFELRAKEKGTEQTEIDVMSQSPNQSNLIAIQSKPLSHGHRGLSGYAPENTLPSFNLAGKMGVWGMETDIQTTSDGEWVIMHDDTVDRTTNGTGLVSSMTLTQFKALIVDTGNNIAKYPNLHPPSVREYLEVCKKWGVVPFMEIKTVQKDSDYDSIIALIKEMGVENACEIHSFSRTTLTEIRKRNKKIILMLAEDITDDSVSFLTGLGNAYISVYYPNLTASLVKKCHDSGIKVTSWTVDNYQVLEQQIAMGVDFITSNYYARV